MGQKDRKRWQEKNTQVFSENQVMWGGGRNEEGVRERQAGWRGQRVLIENQCASKARTLIHLHSND